jgi:feruloyl esterase
VSTTGGMQTQLRAGYAAANTDTGHVGGQATFLTNAVQREDFNERAVHLMVLASERLMQQFYGQRPTFKMFFGCSTGGRQALVELQRYPDDFDGIIGGATAAFSTNLHAGQNWTTLLDDRNPMGAFDAAQRTMLNNAVLARCDSIDGVVDGVIENPRQCNFDPATIQCHAGQDPAMCLTPAQVALARNMWAGPETNGLHIVPGYEFGTEAMWNAILGAPVGAAEGQYRFMVLNDANWPISAFDVKADLERAYHSTLADFNAFDPNITEFVMSGGKLLMYHGWADPGIPAAYSVSYFNAVTALLGEGVRESARLFMVPGMGHCGGGNGTSTFDMIAAMDSWLTSGNAPDSIPASRVQTVNGVATTTRTRPLCPYPSQAVYDGTGSTDEASNFTCRVVPGAH